MASTNKKELGYLILKIIALVVLVSLLYLTFSSILNKADKGGASLLNPGPVYFNMLIFTFFLLLIGFVLWSIFGDPISEQISAFLLQSGGKISKIKYYSKARSLVMQNRLQEAIELYQKILSEDNTDVTAYSELGDIYWEKLKDYSTAFNCYDKMEQYAQESSDIIFAINRKVDIYLSDNNYSKGIEELEKITKKFPKIKDATRAEERIKKLKNKVTQNG